MKHTPLPGTPAIINLYQQRAMQRKRVFDDEDAKPEERREPVLTRRRNGIVQVKNETGLQNVALPHGFCARIVILRKLCGFSQKQLACVMEVKKGTVQHWESGRRYPGRNLLARLAKVFGVTIGKLCE